MGGASEHCRVDERSAERPSTGHSMAAPSRAVSERVNIREGLVPPIVEGLGESPGRASWCARSRGGPLCESVMPQTTGFGRVLLIGALAVVFGLAAASLLAAALGDRWGGRLYGHHRLMSLLVGIGYLGIGLIVVLTIRQG
jgi:hypothetical protein